VIRDMWRSFGKTTFVLAAVMVLALSACGRKGPLEPPPSATAVQGEASEGEPAPAEAPPERRRFFLDFLL
jgi:predicted small lipoprotein YifL